MPNSTRRCIACYCPDAYAGALAPAGVTNSAVSDEALARQLQHQLNMEDDALAAAQHGSAQPPRCGSLQSRWCRVLLCSRSSKSFRKVLFHGPRHVGCPAGLQACCALKRMHNMLHSYYQVSQCVQCICCLLLQSACDLHDQEASAEAAPLLTQNC